MCFSCCGMVGQVRDNVLVELFGDPDSPVNQGALCLKGMAAKEMLYHPDRLVTPLIRTGKRGDGQFAPLAWDEALDMVAQKLKQTRNEVGPQGAAFILGTTKGLIDTYTERFINAFGSPNIATSGHVCFLPRMFAGKVTHGYFPVPDYDGNPDCIILWGGDLSGSRMPEHKKIMALKKKGARLIVIDPYKIKAAKAADLHVAIYPGTDLMLAMGMINVIIKENLFDAHFVENQCIGFDQLATTAAEYDLDKVSQITRIPKETIQTLAVTYAGTGRAVIQWGNAIDHGVNSFATARAISILRAITGKLDQFGCDIGPLYPIPGTGIPEVTLANKMTDELWTRRISRGKPMLPWFKRVLPADIIHTLNTKEPYKLSCVYVTGANPLLTFSNAANAHQAFNTADFMVVSDRFMTPTARMADVILPPATFMEYDSIVAPPYYSHAGVQQKLVHTNGAMSDYDIINGLARRLGLDDLFPSDTHQFFNLVLGPSGLTFDEFRKIGTLTGKREEKKYLENGFLTSSGKVELFSEFLDNAGFSPLPAFIREQTVSDDWPLILTSSKSSFFRHSDNRQLEMLRSAHAEPIVKIHPETAKKFQVPDDEMITIETQNGAIQQKVKVTKDIMPDVVIADFGWWFPEDNKDSSKDADSGWKRSNINILTSDQPPFSPETGSACFRDIPCRIRKGELI
jgi:anaerobic selenocysteine-containing dehydrogenase